MSNWHHISVLVNYGFYHRRQTLVKCYNTLTGHCADWTPKYANPSHNFPLWNVLVVNFFWLSARSSTLLMLAGIRALGHCMNDHLLAISQMAWYCQSWQFLLFQHFIPSIFNFLCIAWKHFAQICCSITLADLQTFYQRLVFYGKTGSFQTRKYDISMMS